MSGASYSVRTKHSVTTIASLLRDACAANDHEFWGDEVSLLDESVFDVTRLHGPRQITDADLLGLAMTHGWRFVTFDEAIPMAAVRGAGRKHLVVL